MPLPALLAPAIGAGGQVLGGTIGAVSQGIQNKKDRQFSEYMYNRQQADAWAMWNAQNEYNTPEAQMNRFKQAGLNPNLVVGGSGAASAGNASPVQAADFKQVSRRAPDFGAAISGGALAFLNGLYDLEIKQAQAKNLNEQTNVIHQQGLLNAANVAGVQGRTESTAFQLQLDKLFGADFQKERLRQIQIQSDVALDENERRALLTSSSLKEAAERLLNMRESRMHSSVDRARMRKQIELMDKTGVLQDLDIKLRKAGINPGDATWMRMAGQLLTKDNFQSLLDGAQDGYDRVSDWISKFFTPNK